MLQRLARTESNDVISILAPFSIFNHVFDRRGDVFFQRVPPQVPDSPFAAMAANVSSAEDAMLDSNFTEVEREIVQRYDEVLATLMSNVDDLFLAVMGSFIVLMQAGFAFLEAGSVRAKNTTNILIKNVVDLCLGKKTLFVIQRA